MQGSEAGHSMAQRSAMLRHAVTQGCNQGVLCGGVVVFGFGAGL
jgi:hypothetical protein